LCIYHVCSCLIVEGEEIGNSALLTRKGTRFSKRGKITFIKVLSDLPITYNIYNFM
jgi:hypothetical protein